VVGQHGGQLGLVLQQRVEVRLRDLGEGRVGRREDGERAGALERVDQAGGLQRRGQRVELPGADGRLDDVLGLGRQRGERQGGECDELLQGGYS
jgi:hypothetical protein